MGNSPQAPVFERRQIPLAARCAMGAVGFGIFGPVVQTLDALGLADRAMNGAWARHEKQITKANPFRGYAPSEHDVFVATYAKSGTNWMMQIAHQLAFHGEGEFEHIHCVVPWPDAPPQLGRYAIPIEDQSVWMASPEKKRVIKTHLNWELLPYSEKARYIIVIRDPKDVFTSNYVFVKSIGSIMIPSMDTWFRAYIAGNNPVGGSWAVNAAGYWAQRHRPNVLITSFKSMKRDLPENVRRVAKFMDVRVSDSVLDKVTRKASFEYMKQIDEKFHVWGMFPGRNAVTMIRKGAQGGSSELLTREQQQLIDETFQAELKRLGSDFPYEEFCDLA